MISLCEMAFPTAEFHIVETNFDNLSKEEYEILKKMQTKMNTLMGKYEPSVKEFNKMRTVDQLFEKNKNQKAIIFLLKKEEKIAGYAVILKYFVKGRYHISDIYLDNRFRSGGIGSFFLSQIEKKLKEKGCTVLQLNCLAANEIGNKLYTKSGYDVFQRAYAKKL